LGNRREGKAFLLSVNGQPEIILDKGYWRNHSSHLLKAGIARLVSVYPVVSFLFHWLSADVSIARVEASTKRDLTIDDFLEMFPNRVQEDVRYVVHLSPSRLR
jgi:hypothetical protein